MKKKIAFIDLLFHWPPTGGSWVDFKEVASRLKKRGYRIRLFVPNFDKFFPRGKIISTPGFPVTKINFDCFSFNFYTVTKRLKIEIDKFKPDYIFIGDGYFLKPFIIHALRNYKIILRFYAYEIICPKNSLYDNYNNKICDNNFFKNSRKCVKCFIEYEKEVKNLNFYHEFLTSLAFHPDYIHHVKRCLSEVKTIIVYNRYTKNILSRYNSNIKIIPSGVDINKFYPVDYFISPNNRKIRLLMSGRVDDPLKGFYILRDACNLLYNKGFDFELLITSQYKLNFTETFIKSVGWKIYDSLPALYNTCDIFIAPYIWKEPFGITVIEAMACGKSVIASNAGELPEIITDNKNGLLFPVQDSIELSRKLEYLLSNPEIMTQLGKCARQTIEKKYNWDNVMEEYYIPLFK